MCDELQAIMPNDDARLFNCQNQSLIYRCIHCLAQLPLSWQLCSVLGGSRGNGIGMNRGSFNSVRGSLNVKKAAFETIVFDIFSITMWHSKDTCHVKVRKVMSLSTVKDNHNIRVSEVMCATHFVAIILLWQTKCRARQILKIMRGAFVAPFLKDWIWIQGSHETRRMSKTYQYSSGIKHCVNHNDFTNVPLDSTSSRTIINQSCTMISHYLSTLYQYKFVVGATGEAVHYSGFAVSFSKAWKSHLLEKWSAQI